MIRDYTASDLGRLKELFSQQSFDWEFPDLSRMVTSRLVSDDSQVVMAACIKPTADAYLLIDHSWQTPGMRLAAFKALHEDIRQQLLKTNIVQVHAWVPPEFDRPFRRRLIRDFGWLPALWQCYARGLE